MKPKKEKSKWADHMAWKKKKKCMSPNIYMLYWCEVLVPSHFWATAAFEAGMPEPIFAVFVSIFF